VKEEEVKLAAPSEKLVLVVDDDELVRSLLERTLRTEGFSVIMSINGLDAGARMQNQAPDLIVTDLMMPGQGGYEFLRNLQSSDNSRIPVFVVTGMTLDESTIQMIRQEANVVEFISKPIKMAQFLAALHRHLKTAPSISPRNRGINERAGGF